MERREAGAVGDAEIGSGLDEEARRFDVLETRRRQEDARAVWEDSAWIGPGGQQCLKRLRVVLDRGENERREPALRRGSDVCSLFNQVPDDCRMLVGGSPHQRRLALGFFSCADVSSTLGQPLNGLKVADASR